MSEVQLIIFLLPSSLHTDILPVVMKFENHLSRPPVIHNINKLRDEAIRNAAKKLQSGDPSEVDVNSLLELQHLFAEGPNMTLTDLLLYPCIYYILVCFSHNSLLFELNIKKVRINFLNK